MHATASHAPVSHHIDFGDGCVEDSHHVLICVLSVVHAFLYVVEMMWYSQFAILCLHQAHLTTSLKLD